MKTNFKVLQELVTLKTYIYAVYKDKRKIGSFDNRYMALAFADEYASARQKPQVNPNIIMPADVYTIKTINADTNKIVSTEIYTANIRIRK